MIKSKKEREAIKHREWQEEHKEHCKEYRRNYYQENQERGTILYKIWREANLRHIREYNKVWRENNPEKIKGIDARHYNKRKRSLEFNPLNKPFRNSVAHHINKIDVIYVPEELHKSIPHCLETGKDMAKINTLALNFALN